MRFSRGEDSMCSIAFILFLDIQPHTSCKRPYGNGGLDEQDASLQIGLGPNLSRSDGPLMRSSYDSKCLREATQYGG